MCETLEARLVFRPCPSVINVSEARRLDAFVQGADRFEELNGAAKLQDGDCHIPTGMRRFGTSLSILHN